MTDENKNPAFNVGLQSKLNRVIHLLGLHYGYRLYALKKRLSHSRLRGLRNRTRRLSRRMRYKVDMVSHPEQKQIYSH